MEEHDPNCLLIFSNTLYFIVKDRTKRLLWNGSFSYVNKTVFNFRSLSNK